jgi:WD40 repeat protein
MSVGSFITPFVTIYNWDTGAPVKISNPSTLPAGGARGGEWSPDGRYLAIAAGNSPYIMVYDGISGIDADTEFVIPDLTITGIDTYIKAE